MKRPTLAWPLLVACAGPHLRGADGIPREREPGIPARATLSPSDCRDERGATAANPAVTFLYFEPSDGPRQLLERRVDHDSVLIQNSYEEAGARVFAYVSSDGEHPDVLHRVRLGADGAAELSLSRAFELRETAQGFRAEPTRVALRCSLKAHADAAHGDAGG